MHMLQRITSPSYPPVWLLYGPQGNVIDGCAWDELPLLRRNALSHAVKLPSMMVTDAQYKTYAKYNRHPVVYLAICA